MVLYKNQLSQKHYLRLHGAATGDTPEFYFEVTQSLRWQCDSIFRVKPAVPLGVHSHGHGMIRLIGMTLNGMIGM